MKALITVRSEFAASHVVTGHSTCGRGDGHAWIVWVSVTGEPKYTTGTVTAAEGLQAALDLLTAELANKHLNDMLPGVVATPEGVAIYVHERLLLDHPAITRVAVEIRPGYRAEVEWPLR